MSLSPAIDAPYPLTHNHPGCCCLSLSDVKSLKFVGVFIGNFKHRRAVKYEILKAKATGDKETKPKTKSVICTDCDGNGALQCSQCKGTGINPQDFFNRQFKAGDSCWLCGGKKEMLCGNCNGAGFVGGFLSGFDY